jgi:hypothetical protein
MKNRAVTFSHTLVGPRAARPCPGPGTGTVTVTQRERERELY